MKIERIAPDGSFDSAKVMQFAQAIRAGQTLYCSGQTGMDANMKVAEDYEAECRQLFENMKIVLEAAGCTFADVVDATSLHTPGSDIPCFWRVRNEYFAEPWPAWTMIGDVGLATPALHAEVKVTAVIPD